jgi:hypothetical protein
MDFIEKKKPIIKYDTINIDYYFAFKIVGN